MPQILGNIPMEWFVIKEAAKRLGLSVDMTYGNVRENPFYALISSPGRYSQLVEPTTISRRRMVSTSPTRQPVRS